MNLNAITLAISRPGGVRSWDPLAMFTSGVQGVLYDPSDTTTLFQNAAGTTPVTAVEQPVGLMLDKSKGLVLGSDVVINGSFSTDTNWVKGTGWSISGGYANASSAAGFLSQTNAGSLTVGKLYKITFTVSNYSSGSVRPYLGYNPSYGVAVSANGTYSQYLRYTDTSTVEYGMYSNTSFTGSVDNFSIQEVTGNHAFNSSGNSANFPVLSARYNLLTKTELLSDAAWSKQNLSATEIASSGPDGSTASLLTENTANNYHLVDSSSSAVSTGVISAVVYLKPNGRTQPAVQIKGATPEGYAVFNLTGSGSVQSQTNAVASIEAAANGYYKCTVTVTVTTGGSAYLRVFLDVNSYIGNGTSGIYIWGADLRVANDALGQPAYQRVNTSTDYDTVGFKPYLRFNGTNQWLQTNSIDFSYGDKMFFSAGVRKLSDATAYGSIVELSAIWSSSNGSFEIYAPQLSGLPRYEFGVRGTDNAAYAPQTFTAPITNVLTSVMNIGAATQGDELIPRVNGVVNQTNSNNTSAGTGNFGNYPLYIGARAGSSLWFNGRLYGMVVAGKQASAAEITSTETYINQKTGAF